jgi:hypothetical protein
MLDNSDGIMFLLSDVKVLFLNFVPKLDYWKEILIIFNLVNNMKLQIALATCYPTISFFMV